jgi:hypothetical protein
MLVFAVVVVAVSAMVGVFALFGSVMVHAMFYPEYDE